MTELFFSTLRFISGDDIALAHSNSLVLHMILLDKLINPSTLGQKNFRTFLLSGKKYISFSLKILYRRCWKR